MASAYTKGKLKLSREALAKQDWAAASDAAASVLEHEPDNYNANVFQGLSLLHLGQFELSEQAYRKAARDQPTQILAWQGLVKFYDQRKDWNSLRDVLHTLMDLYNDADDATKCAETFQRLLAIEREEGGRKSVLETLALLLPDSKYYSTLSLLDVPDQTQPDKTTTFETQLAIHVHSLQVLTEMIELCEAWEADFIQKEADKRRMRLDGANKGKQALTNEVRLQVFSQSRLPSLYDQILSHPSSPDELRTEIQSKLLRQRVGLLNSYPPPRQLSHANGSSTGTAAIDTEAQAELDRAEQAQQQEKVALRDEIVQLASGMVIIGLVDELAWQIELEWRPVKSLPDLNMEQLRKHISLFPRSGRTMAFKAFLLHIQDPQFAYELKEQEKLSDTEFNIPKRPEDLLNLAVDGLEECPESILTHRIAATFYLLDHDYQSASDLASSALHVASSMQQDSALDLQVSKLGISALLLTALVHLHPPQHHARAMRLADSVLEHNQHDIDALLTKAYIEQYAGRWKSAKQLFQLVRSLASSIDHNSYKFRTERCLSLSSNPDQEAWIESAWCDVKLGELQAARAEMQSILDRIDPVSFESATAELRAKVWWRLGHCLWQMDGEYRADPAHAFTAFITSLKRNPAYAPAYTSLGLYYEDVLSPPDLSRASKCFQKAFELDSRENEAAFRLAQGFAEEKEWDLVEVVARRTIEGEGGAQALGGARGGSHAAGAAVQASRRHLSQNAWAWKAIGSVEIANNHYEQAILALQIALRADAEDGIAWQRLGEAYVLAGRHVAALKCFVKCLELVDSDGERLDEDRGWQARYSIGDVHLQLGNFATAIETLKAILETRPAELGVRIALANAFLFAARQEFASGYVERAEVSTNAAIVEAGRVLLTQDKHLRTAWKVVSDCTLQLSKFGILVTSNAIWTHQYGLHPLMTLAKQLGTDDKLPSIHVVTYVKLEELLGDPEKSAAPFVLLQCAIYLYKLRVVLNANDEKVVGSAWGDLATALYLFSRKVLESSSQPLLPGSRSADVNVVEAAETLSKQSRLQAIGSVKEALRTEPGNETYWLLLGNLTFSTSLKLAQHSFIRAIEAAPKSAVGWTNLALLYLHHDDTELANEAFISAQTADPDYAPAWVGQALIAQGVGDHRASRVLFEHAVSLTEGSLDEADYGLGQAVFQSFARADHDKTGAGAGADSSLFGASFALSAMISHVPSDVDALHLSALLCERLGQTDLAISRITQATSLLEDRYEMTESSAVARQYAIAQANLGRIRLSLSDYQGAAEAFDSAVGLIDDDTEGDAEQVQEQVAVRIDTLRIAKVQSLFGLAQCHHFRGQSEAARTAIREAIAYVGANSASMPAFYKLYLGAEHAKILHGNGMGSASIDETKEVLLSDLNDVDAGTDSQTGTHIASVLALAVLGLESKDADLLDATLGELETHLASDQLHNDAGTVLAIVTVLIRARGGHDGNTVTALRVLHETIQTISSRSSRNAKPWATLFVLHLAYLHHAAKYLSNAPASDVTAENSGEDGDAQSAEIAAYVSLTQDLFLAHAPAHPVIEAHRSTLHERLARLKQINSATSNTGAQQVSDSIRPTSSTLHALAILDAPYTSLADSAQT